MYDFAKRPLWILSHLLVLSAVLVMLRLGLWQMGRWHTEQRNVERIEAGVQAEPVPLEELLAGSGDPATPAEVDEALEFRRVTVTGTWDSASEVLIRNRSKGGQPGGWLLTPLVEPDGDAVAVLRGWIPLDAANAGAPYEGTAPPPGPATVTGVVQLTHQGGGLAPSDPGSGRLDSLARVDLVRFARQLEAPLAPVWVMLQSSEPPQPTAGLDPVEVDLPSPSQNFSYMMQWWFFATIAAVGYLLILRKVARSRAGLGGLSQVPEEDPPELLGAESDRG